MYVIFGNDVFFVYVGSYFFILDIWYLWIKGVIIIDRSRDLCIKFVEFGGYLLDVVKCNY